MEQKSNFFELGENDYKPWCLKHNLPSFTLSQVHTWVTEKNIIDFNLMTNISKINQAKLADVLNINPFLTIEPCPAADKSATKYIFQISPHVFIEAVAIQEIGYETLCISSQAGCPVDCKFCLTGVSGLKKNLTVHEIVAQFAIIKSFGHNITHVVFMGMGEPLLNLKSVLPALDWLQSDWGFNISKRHITVSTSGYLAGIETLINEDIHLNLAFSVGSADPAIRKTIMPIETRNPITEVAQKLSQYGQHHNRKLTLEYTLLAGVNDSDNCAIQLANLALFLNAKVNLINLNPHPKIPFTPVTEIKLQQFKQLLIDQRVRTTVRYSKGQDVVAACGQLGESNLKSE
ncbi:MAG: 23S rRNA (adenine(2503)-C(2))-methyltransferase RlmN [Candidatus Margulisiibacteriota bacterium]